MTDQPDGFGDQVVRMMLGGQPEPAPQSLEDHFRNIEQFWQRNANALPQPPPAQTAMQKDPGAFQGEMRGRGAGESREPGNDTVEAQLAPYAPVGIPGEGMALNALSGVGRTLINPKVAGTIAAGAGMFGLMPGASEAGDSPKQQLERQRAQLVEQQQAAFKRREANADSPGKLWKQADKDYQDATAQIANVDAKLKDYANTPEGQQATANEAARLKAAADDKLARTPFRERHPDIADALPKIGSAVSFLAPLAMGSKNRLGSFFPGSYTGRVRSAINAFDNADPEAREIPRAVLSNLVEDAPGALKRMGKGIAAAAGGGVAGAELGLAPDAWDAYGSMPEGPERDAAKARVFNLKDQAVRIGQGTLMGLVGYELGGLAPGREPPLAEARGRVNPLAGKSPESSALPASTAPAAPTMPPLSGPAPLNRLAGATEPLEPAPAPKKKPVIGGSHPDHNWDEKSRRWKDENNRFYLPGGKPPK